jgi:hypothetical protein
MVMRNPPTHAEALVQSHRALNDVLALVWREWKDLGLSVLNDALDALATNLIVEPGLPVTAGPIATEVRRRVGLKGEVAVPDARPDDPIEVPVRKEE